VKADGHLDIHRHVHLSWIERSRQMKTVWVCIAQYAPEDDIEPIAVAAISAQAAEEQCYNAVHEHCKGTGVDEDEWIVGTPKELKVLK
jgi:hypothetical protein